MTRGRIRAVPATVADRAVNLGATQRCADGSIPQTLFKWQVDDEDGDAMTLYVKCDEFVIPPAAVGTGDFRPMVHVEWGSGTTTNAADLEVTYRQRLPLVCSSLYVQAFIGAFPLALSNGTFGTAPVPVGARAKFSAFICAGTDALNLYPTRWVTQMNLNAGLIAAGQLRLATFRAFADAGASATPGYFLLFDKASAPIAGDTPVDAFPFEPQPAAGDTPSGAVTLDLGQTRAFTAGLAWGVSTTPFTFTPIVAARAFVTAELET